MLQKIFKAFQEVVDRTVSNEYFKMRVCYSVIGTFLFSMAANGFAYLNFYPQHDAINHAYITAVGWEVRLGRYLQPLYAKIRGQITIPWLIGILSMLFLMVTVILVSDMFEMENKYQILLTAGFLSANVTITQMCAVFVYIYDICMAALMLVTLGVWSVYKIKGWNGMICAGICFGGAMGLYQAYMVVAVIWFILLIARKVIVEKLFWKERLSEWSKYIVSVIFGVGIYYVLWKITLKIYDVEAATGKNTVAQLKNVALETWIEKTKTAYINFMNFFVGNDVVLGTMAKYSTILLIVLVLAGVIYYIRKNKLCISQYLIIGSFIICYPLVALISSIAMEKENIDYLTSFGVGLVHPILLMIVYGVYKEKNRIALFCKSLACILSIAVLFSNISFSNGAYVTTKVMYDRTLSVMTRILDDMDATEGYVLNETPVVIVCVEAPENISVITDRYESMRAFNELSISYPQTFKSYANLLGYDLENPNDLSGVDLEYVECMPSYPHEGYCQIVNGKMIVKFG